MNIFRLVLIGGSFCRWWWVVVDIFWLVGSDDRWWWVVVDIFWLVVSGDGWWQMVAQFSLNLSKAITTKQAWRCKQKIPNPNGTKLRKENKFLTYFKPMFPFSTT